MFNCGKPAYREGILKDPLGAFSFALPYLVLRSMGRRCISLERAIEGLLRNGLLLSVEMVPFRTLDRLYFLRVGGLLKSSRELLHWYRKTTLGARKEAAVFNVDDAYSVTHTVFYMCDFGYGSTLLGQTESARIVVTLQSLLIHSWRIQNWDLMGEVLASFACLGIGRADQFVREAETAYCEAYRTDGTVPPNRDAQRRQRKRSASQVDADAEANFYFRDCYHSTLVFLLFASMNLRRCETAAS
jgi:hypothetical protein